MKNIIYILLLFPSMLFSQNWQWANKVGSNIFQSTDFANVITDGTNSYLVGRYSGALYLQTDTLYAIGTNGLFVIKYDASGNEMWAKGFGGNNTAPGKINQVYGVFNPTDNYIYLSGRFYGQMILDTVDTLTAGSFSELYMAKMDLNGNFIWGKSVNTYLADDMAYVFVQPDGNLFLAGTVGDTAYFDTIQVATGGFFARYDTNGNCLWARHEFSGITGININISFIGNDIVMSGTFNSNPTTIDTTTLINNNNSFDGYLSRMDSIGRIKWIQSFGYGGSDAFSGAVIDNSNNIFICGAFEDSIKIDGVTLTNQGRDILIAKFTESGNLVWLRQTNAINNVGGGGDITIDNNENCYITGYFSGSDTFGTYNISTSNTYDMFLTRYNTNGDCLGVRHFGYAGGNSVVTDNSDNPICAGGFQNTVTIGTSTFTSNGYFDIFLAKSDVFTGIDTIGRNANNQLLIYANPNQGKCTITVPDDFLHEKNLTLSIYDNAGKRIQQKTFEMNDGKIKLNLEAEAKGVYNVTLTNGKKWFSGRIIFE
ncbi:MAG: T9SS type A sorting domain-containing protein [Nitrosopumilus sp.]|nr:T9SS type A sorting domain-containing protein [Nitrosopumilus sp.]